jgi:site-specific DNA recombinase
LARAHSGQWLPQELQARRENLRNGQQQHQKQLDRLTEAYLGGVMPLPEYQRRRGGLEQRLGALTQQSEQLREQASCHSHVAQLTSSVKEFCRRVQIGLADATFERRRQLVELLIDRVVVTDEQVEIRYVFPTSPAGEKIRFSHLRSDYFSMRALAGDCLRCSPVSSLTPNKSGILVEPIYSWRSATSGSTFVARRAGR